MTQVQVDLPPAIQEALTQIAKRDGISAQQLILSAVIDKLAALQKANLLEELAARGSRERLAETLKSVPHVPPELGDELPPELRRAP
jgi:hypothetical protein